MEMITSYIEQFKAMGAASGIFSLLIALALVGSIWKIFAKAGVAGWKCLIPIYNIYVMLKICGRPGWWLVLYCIPLVNVLVAIINTFDIAKRFNKDVGFGFGLLFLGFIFYPVLGFGKSEYTPA